MNCMKCGRPLEEGQVFCAECLDNMEQEPVKITAPVFIPAQPPRKNTSHRRPLINAEEEMVRLQKTNQNLIMALILALTAAFLFMGLAYYREFWEVVEELGRNYSVVETVTGG